MEERNNGTEELFPLDDAAIEFIDQAQKNLEELAKQSAAINERVNGMLNYFAMVHKLQGRWLLAANKKELMKTPDAAIQPDQIQTAQQQ